tara:strand:+ start:2259 stop:2981 length:723 start_codon:yes stop_codon:yes gene_type:complete
MNNWYDHFDVPPDYWVISNSEYSIPLMYKEMNKYGSPILYSKDGDDSSDEYIQETLTCDYLPYDQRHFKGHDCVTILKNFEDHYIKNNNFNFKEYGNNNIMWHPPRIGGGDGWAGFDLYGRCCKGIEKNELTIQEHLQKLAKYEKHYSTGDTVAFHAIAFAILMGCNPIYISGMDLDYSRGYANANKHVPFGHFYMWQENSENLLSDMRILLSSALNLGTEIINLNTLSWHDVFPQGRIK